jgi:Mg2+/citrate symporter
MPYTITDMIDKVKNHIKKNKIVYTYTFLTIFILVLIIVGYKKGYRLTENFMLGKAGTLSLQVAMPLTNVFIDENNKIVTDKDNEVVEVAAACVCAVAVFVVCTCAAVFFFRTNFFFGCLGSDSSWYSLNESGLTSLSGVLFKK